MSYAMLQFLTTFITIFNVLYAFYIHCKTMEKKNKYAKHLYNPTMSVRKLKYDLILNLIFNSFLPFKGFPVAETEFCYTRIFGSFRKLLKFFLRKTLDKHPLLKRGCIRYCLIIMPTQKQAWVGSDVFG